MNKNRDFLAALSLISQIGMVMALPIIGCIILGNYLDIKFNTGIFFLIVFTILGVGAAFRNLFVITSKVHKNGKNRKD
ncbi:MAG: AtpZ/AtpI family protein [Epulopiscium sp.]|nr:AtpZ/AtpI family protein [Candidatus Epulonipiscium sp.]